MYILFNYNFNGRKFLKNILYFLLYAVNYFLSLLYIISLLFLYTYLHFLFNYIYDF